MKISNLNKFTYIYLALPLGLFLVTWLDYLWASIFSLSFIFAYYKCVACTNNSIIVDNKKTYMFLSIALIWCFLSGIGYFYYQSFDYHFRNAVFRDLINYEWPVFYDKANTPMVYYMGFWLIPALISKLFSLVINDEDILFLIGNGFLYLYAVIGVVLVFAQLSIATKAENNKKILAAVFLFIFFSGLDIIGYNFFTIMKQPFDYHLEWWATIIQYSSITTGMFWVFNQFIPIALITLLIFNERKIRNFGFLVAISLFSSPYPSAGIGLIALFYAINVFCCSANKKDFILNEIFSVQNIIAVFWIIPIVICYYITNSEGIYGFIFILDYIKIKQLIIFMVLEFLIYALIIGKMFYKDVFFVTAIFSLLIIPFLRLDMQNNFCMRASIPAIVLLTVYVIRFMFENKNRVLSIVLCIVYMIGAVTPVTEFYRSFYYVSNAKKINLVTDDIYTLNQPYIRMPIFGFDVNHQYTAKNYMNDLFWQILAKKHYLDEK